MEGAQAPEDHGTSISTLDLPPRFFSKEKKKSNFVESPAICGSLVQQLTLLPSQYGFHFKSIKTSRTETLSNMDQICASEDGHGWG